MSKELDAILVGMGNEVWTEGIVWICKNTENGKFTMSIVGSNGVIVQADSFNQGLDELKISLTVMNDFYLKELTKLYKQ